MSPVDVSSCCEFVGRTPLFADVPPEPMERALRALEVREYAPGAEVIAESIAGAASADSALYILIEGQLLAARAIGAERRQALSAIQPGEFFGEMIHAD